MKDKGQKKVDRIPANFRSYEEAAEFWDSHDTTDYPEAFRTIKVDVKPLRRRFEVELDESLHQALERCARKARKPVQRIVSDLLRRQLKHAA